MEDFFYAGGLPAVLKELLPLLHGERADRDRPHARPRTCAGRACCNADVIRAAGRPLAARAASAILRGNLCPDGAVIKRRPPLPICSRHRGRAVVFETKTISCARIDDPALAIDETPCSC